WRLFCQPLKDWSLRAAVAAEQLYVLPFALAFVAVAEPVAAAEQRLYASLFAAAFVAVEQLLVVGSAASLACAQPLAAAVVAAERWSLLAQLHGDPLSPGHAADPGAVASHA